MKIPWKGDRCIFCLREGDLCKEHLIPASLGGCLTSEFLCKNCNSAIGHRYESDVKSDLSIILAAMNLRGIVPALAESLIAAHPHIAHGEGGAVHGHIKAGEFRVRSRKLEDGSLIQPADQACKSVATILKRKECLDDAPLEEALRCLDGAPENERVEIAAGLEVIKWAIERIEPDLSSGSMMNPLAPAKTAFEFLASHVGTAIYQDVPQIAEVRNALLEGTYNDEIIRVERLTSGQYKPIHGIVFESNDPYAKVQVRLFGWLAFRVSFLRISVSGQRFVYTHVLDTNQEQIAVVDS